VTSQKSIDQFFAPGKFAIVGASRKGNKFGNSILKEFIKKGITIYPVHPEVDSIDGISAYKNFDSLPEKIESLINVVPPSETKAVVSQAKESGIKNIWLQLGSGSNEAIQYCKENDINVISGECILMFTEPVGSIHKFHKWIWKILGKLPK